MVKGLPIIEGKEKRTLLIIPGRERPSPTPPPQKENHPITSEGYPINTVYDREPTSGFGRG